MTGYMRTNSLLYKFLNYVRRKLWVVIVAYMLGIHNFYKGEDHTPADIATIELNEEQEIGAPKD